MIDGLPIEQVGEGAGFRHLSSIAGIAIDLRYAGPDNFTGRDLYSPFDCAWLHVDAASALERVVAWLARERPGCTALILDALRPQRVQEALWDALDGTGLRMYLAPPERGSIHSFGMALDITILDEAGRELDMGTGFDDMSERSHPAREDLLLARGELTPQHVENRQLLRAAMAHAGFVGIASEWWHFDYGERDWVRQTFQRVL
ncbi:MAG TPA: M15 family metallopeptidase [Telluria sp.]|jgi:D-alanyl-D-alanine dipeptidase